MKTVMKSSRGNIVSGIVTGVVAGILVSLTLGLYQVVIDFRARNDQVDYVRTMIERALYNIENTSNNRDRLLQYNLLLRGLDRFISDYSASSEITFDEREQIRRAFPYSTGGHVIYIQNANALPNDAPSYFRTVVEQFREIPWLGLKEE